MMREKIEVDGVEESVGQVNKKSEENQDNTREEVAGPSSQSGWRTKACGGSIWAFSEARCKEERHLAREEARRRDEIASQECMAY